MNREARTIALRKDGHGRVCSARAPSVEPSTGTEGAWARTDRWGLAAIMFTDIVGYGILTQRDEALALELVEEHDRLLRPLFDRYDGREIKAMGDGFLVVFPSALEATRCAVEIQRTLCERNAAAPPGREFQIRIGIHVGDVVHRGVDVLGDGVNIASRIQHLSKPGGICLSWQVVDLIRGKLKHPLVKLGNAELKHVRLPVGVYQVRLPWQWSRTGWADRLAFALHQTRGLSWLDAVSKGIALLLAGVSVALWQGGMSDKAIHATVWVGAARPAPHTPADGPQPAALSLLSWAPVARDQGGIPRPQDGPGQLEFTASRSDSVRATVAADGTLFALMARRDLGPTVYFARQYDHARRLLRRAAGRKDAAMLAQTPSPVGRLTPVTWQEALGESVQWVNGSVVASPQGGVCAAASSMTRGGRGCPEIRTG